MLSLSCTRHEYPGQEIVQTKGQGGPAGPSLLFLAGHRVGYCVPISAIINHNRYAMMFIKITYISESGEKVTSGISLPEPVRPKQIAELHVLISRLAPEHAVDFFWKFDGSLEPSFIRGKRT